MSSGSFAAGSTFAGFMLHPSSVTPSPIGTRMNSISGRFSAASLARSFALSVSVRTAVWSPSRTSSTTGGVVKFDQVWTAHFASGEMSYSCQPACFAGESCSVLLPSSFTRNRYRWVAFFGEAA